MSKLHDQIRRHYRSVDEVQEPVTWTEIVERLEADTTLEVSPISRPPRSLVMVGFAALVIAVIGVLGVITSPTNLSDPSPPSSDTVGETAPTTPTTPTTQTPSIPLGNLTWTRLVGDSDGLPFGNIEKDEKGAYFVVEPGPLLPDRLWRSEDALTWIFEDDPEEVPISDVETPISLPPSTDDATAVAVLPSGGFVALVNVREGYGFHEIVGDAEDVQLWVTTDGVEWQQYAPLPFELADSSTVHLVSQPDAVLLFIGLFDGPQPTQELWTTTDGISWQQADVEFPRASNVVQFDLGLAAFEGPEEGFWISTDRGMTWEHFDSPISDITAGSATMGAAGDILYIGTEAGSRRTLWIGKFEG